VIAPLDIHGLLRDLRIADFVGREEGLEMVLEIDPALPGYIRTDGTKVRHILMNFLSNAIKFTKMGRVVLRARIKEPRRMPGRQRRLPGFNLNLRLRIRGLDFSGGSGRIFDSFVQVNPSRKPSGGVGLGLAISKKLAGLLAGKLTCVARSAREAFSP